MGLPLKRSRLANWLLLIGVTAVGLPGLLYTWELYARWETGVDQPRPPEDRTDILQYEPAVWARHVLAQKKVNARAWMPGTYWPINSRGYRGPEFETAKAPGVWRVIVYGGSGAFDPVSTGNDDWPHRVERILRARGHAVEVINAGVPGHSSSDSMGRLFAEGHHFAPDVVLFYHGWNDIKDLSDRRTLLRRRKPWKASSDPRRTPSGPIDRWWMTRSVAYGQLRGRWMTYRYGDGERAPLRDLELGSELAPTALAQLRMDVATFVDVARNAGAEPILVHQATLVSADLDEAARERIRYDYVRLDHATVVEAYRQIDRILIEVAEAKGVTRIDPREELNGRPGYFRDHVHLTLSGSEELAKLVAAGAGAFTKTPRKEIGQ